MKSGSIFFFVFLGVLYALSITTQLTTLYSLGKDILTPLQLAEFIVALPYILFTNGDAFSKLFLVSQSFLLTLYITLFLQNFALRRRLRTSYGISGSLLSLFSVGCVACGSFLSPMALIASIGVPLSIAGWWNIFIGLFSLILLAAGCVILAIEHKFHKNA